MAESQERAARGRLAKAASSSAAGATIARGEDVHLFCMRLMGARYAVEAPLVTEVVRLGPLTRIPASPPFLLGVFTHRGEVLAVIDIHQVVGDAPLKLNPNTRVAIAHIGTWKVALVTEAIEGLLSIPAGQVDSPPAASGGAAEFLSGVGRDAKGDLAILDLKRLVEVARARSVPT